MKNIFKKYLSVIVILAVEISYADILKVNLDSIGKKTLNMHGNIEVSIIDFDEVEQETHRSWKTKLIVKKDSKVIFEKYPIIEAYEETYSYFIVPIRKGAFFEDLNGDKFPEFAVAVEHGGNAPTTSAIVFSVKSQTVHVYKHAWYQQEGGQEVVWNYNEAPKKCFINSQGTCDYL